MADALRVMSLASGEVVVFDPEEVELDAAIRAPIESVCDCPTGEWCEACDEAP